MSANMKVVLLGCNRKSEVLHRYIDDKYCECTSEKIGAQFKTKVETFVGTSVKVQVWGESFSFDSFLCLSHCSRVKCVFLTDVACSTKMSSILKSYIKGAAAIVLVYDVTDRPSFEKDMPDLLEFIEKNAAPNVIKTAIGCRCEDLDRRVIRQSDAEELFTRHQMSCYEVSAKTGKGVADFFRDIAEIYISRTPY